MRLIEELHVQLAEDEIDGPEALRRWYRWTYAARITTEIIAFLEGELRALSLDPVRGRQATLIRLFNRSLRSGMALLGGEGVSPPRDFREAQRFDATAELALFVAIGACSVVLVERTEDPEIDERRALVRWSAAWPDADRERRTSAWDLLRRLETGTAVDPIVRRRMHGMDLDHQILRTDLADGGWFGASAKFADFSRANLSDADLSRADLSRADLSDADLSRANLSDADLSDADLSRANLRYVDLSLVRGLTKSQLRAAQNVD